MSRITLQFFSLLVKVVPKAKRNSNYFIFKERIDIGLKQTISLLCHGVYTFNLLLVVS